MRVSPQFVAFSLEQQNEKWPANESGDYSNGDFSGSEERARERVADHEESRTEKKRRGDQRAVIGARNKADRMWNNKADEPDGAAECGHCAREDRAHEIYKVLNAAHMDPARSSPLFSSAKRIEMRTQPKQASETSDNERCRSSNGLHVSGIHCAHGPPRHKITLTEIRRVVNEHDQGAEYKIQRNACQKQGECR